MIILFCQKSNLILLFCQGNKLNIICRLILIRYLTKYFIKKTNGRNMSRKNLIFSTIFLLAIVSVSYLSVSSVNTNRVVDKEQNNDNVAILVNPKSSGYAVSEYWNDTTAEIVTCVAVSADGIYMVVGTEIGAGPELFFYNTTNHDGIPMWSYDGDLTYSSLAISADGQYIVAGSEVDGVAVLLNSSVPDLGNSKELVWLVDLADEVYSVDISADGELIAVSADNDSKGAIYLYDNNYSASNYADEYLWYCGVPNTTLSVAISADGNYVAAGSKKHQTEDNLFYFNTTDYTQGAEQPPMWSSGGMIIVSDSIKISADGGYIIVNVDAGVLFFDSTVPESGNPKVYVWQVDLDHPISTVDISANGKYVAVGMYDDDNINDVNGFVFLYNTTKPIGHPIDKTSEYLWYYLTEGIINSASFTEDGEYLVVGTDYAPETGADNESTIFLFENAVDKYIGFHDPDWFFNTSHNVTSVSISGWGNHFAVGGPYTPTSGRAYLFHHARPIPPVLLPYVADDDDDDDPGDIIVVVVIIVLASIGGFVVVIIVLIKKGIIDLSKLKR